VALVYLHKRKDTNQVFYVGIGHTQKRVNQKKGRNYDWYKEVKSSNGFVSEILYNNISWEEACLKEKELISFYGRRDLNSGILVNRTPGGDGVRFFGEKNGMFGKKHTLEVIEKCRLAAKKQVHTKQSKEKKSFAFRGEKNPRALAVIQYSKNGDYIKEFPYIRLAKKETGATNISAACKGKLKMSGGFIWKYKD